MNRKTRYFVIVSLLVLGIGVGVGLVAYYVGVPTAFAQQGPDELQLVPGNALVVAYANVHEVMASNLREQRAPGPSRNSPTASASSKKRPASTSKPTSIESWPRSSRPTMASVAGPRSGLIIAAGRFDQVKIESLMREHGATEETYRGRRMFAARRRRRRVSSLAFVEPGLVAVGSTALVRSAIDRKDGGGSVRTNDDIMTLVRSLDRGNVWAVGRFDALTSQAKLAIECARASCRRSPGSRSAATSTAGCSATSGWRPATRRRPISSAMSFAASSRSATCRRARIPSSQPSSVRYKLNGSGKTVAVSFELSAETLDLLARRPGLQPGR